MMKILKNQEKKEKKSAPVYSPFNYLTIHYTLVERRIYIYRSVDPNIARTPP